MCVLNTYVYICTCVFVSAAAGRSIERAAPGSKYNEKEERFKDSCFVIVGKKQNSDVFSHYVLQ